MGEGKKFSAIAAAIIYRPEWPILIICPQVLARTWQNEFIKWIPRINREKIQIIEDCNFRKEA